MMMMMVTDYGGLIRKYNSVHSYSNS